MKNLILILSLLILSHQNLAQTIAGAIAEIHFDSTTEESISGITPSGFNFMYAEDRLGNPNSAGIGIVDFGDVDFARMDTSDFSISFWFKKIGSLWPARTILGKQHAIIGDYTQYLIRFNGVFNAVESIFKPAADSSEVVVAQNWVSDSTWIHFVVTLDRDGMMKMYMDSEFLMEKNIEHLKEFPANIDNASLILGHENMALDEVIFFRKALDSMEINDLYNGDLTSVKRKITRHLQPLKFYPNPNNGIFNITFPENFSSEISLSIFNNLGQEVFLKNKIRIENSIEIDLTNFPKGIYYLLAKTKEGIFNGKIQMQ